MSGLFVGLLFPLIQDLFMVIFLFGIFLFTYHLISFVKNTGVNKSFIECFNNSSDRRVEFLSGFKTYGSKKNIRNWISPVQLPQPPVKEFVIDGITFRIPELINNNWNARCYGTDLPCLYKIDPRLKARGKNIHSGFHLEK